MQLACEPDGSFNVSFAIDGLLESLRCRINLSGPHLKFCAASYHGACRGCVCRRSHAAKVCAYHQRRTFRAYIFRPFRRLVLGYIKADFCDHGRIFQHFSNAAFFPFASDQIFMSFIAIAQFFSKFKLIFVDLREECESCNFSSKYRRFFGILQHSSDFERNDATIAVFEKNSKNREQYF
jgi:hypothetical protein